MAKKKNEYSIADALDSFLSNHGLKEKALVQRIISDWSSLMGKPVGDHTGKIWFQKGVLYVEMTHPAWKNEMIMESPKIKERVNKHIGAELVKDVKIV